MSTVLAVATLIAVMAVLIVGCAYAMAYMEEKAEPNARRNDVPKGAA